MDEKAVQAGRKCAYVQNGNGGRSATHEMTTTAVSAVGRRLTALAEMVPPPEIAELWDFPPLDDVEQSEEFFLFTRFLGGEGRRLYSARMLPANGSPARQVVVEHGTVPADRMPRLVDRLQRRLGRGHTPRHVVVNGRVGVWETLISGNGSSGDE